MDSKKSLSRIGTATIVLLVLVGMAVPLGAGAGDKEPNEPNDAQGAATPITGDSIDGEISISGGTDWFAKEYAKGESIEIVITKPLWDRGQKMSLHSQNGTQLDNTTALQGVDIAVLSAKAPESGTYGVKIEGAESDVKNSHYTVHTNYEGSKERTDVELPDETLVEKEPNDNLSNAIPVTKKKVSGTLTDDRDRDEYVIQAEKGEKMSILLKLKNNGYNLDGATIHSVNHDGETIGADHIYLSEENRRGQSVVQAKRDGRLEFIVDGDVIDHDKNLSYTFEVESLGQEPLPSEKDSTSTEEPSTTEQTAQGTETATEQADTDTGTATASTESDATQLFGPGFTGPAAILALLLTGLFGWRRS
ncbi:hypothetical protein [Halocatena halophila]|uniref:hypothetical protein n=1 Tax=Halocatena halophila TaxID=2814576 RepID=UPI002ED568A6